ncbi:MAG: phosphoribosyltransferase family protein [Microthrixaceae bacterium]
MTTPADPAALLAQDRTQLLTVIKERALLQFEQPRQLSSGEMSRDFIDAKFGLSRGVDLKLACKVIVDELAAAGIDFDAIGGLTLGADQFAHGVASFLGDHREWFVVRKQAKGRGTNQLVEGAKLNSGTRVVLVDDIVTTGGSIQKAYEQVLDTGAQVVAAVTMVDRSEIAAAFFAQREVPYLPIFTYHHLGIVPVG